MRTTARGNRIEVDFVHDFIRCALTHDAIADPVFALLYEHIVGGRYHPSVIATALQPFIDEVLGAATDEDWQTVGDELTAAGRPNVFDVRDASHSTIVSQRARKGCKPILHHGS